MSQISFVGRLVSNPESHSSGIHNASSFRLAMLRQRRAEGGEAGEVFVDVVTFDALAENVARRLEAGAEVAVTGRLESRVWITEEGSKRSQLQVVADEITCFAEDSTDAEPSGVDLELP